jgi:glycosyltransferase involved in cell wall biosynthesis
MDNKQDIELSIVVPILNEADNLEPLHEEICQAVSGRYSIEIVFIDDGSSDNTSDVLSKILQKDPRVRIIRFRRNFGQTAALSAGFEHARGRIIIPLDADGQNDPADIPRLIEKLNEGYDIVSGWRQKRHDTFLTRKLPSLAANWLTARITGIKLHDFGCTLKAYRAGSLKEIRLYGEMHRFIPALASWSGEKVGELVVNHRPRTRGTAKYGLGRTFKVILDLITIRFLMSFSTKPIYVFGGLGVLSMLGAGLSGAAVLYQKFISASHLPMNRNPLLVLTAMLITASIQFVLMGLLAEILVRTYHESQGRPIYVIEKIFEYNDKD